MEAIEQALIVTKTSEKNLKKIIEKYERDQFAKNLKTMQKICSNLKLKRIQLYEIVSDEMFTTRPAISEYFYYYLDEEHIRKRVKNNCGYDCEEVVKDLQYVIQVNKLFEKMCIYVMKKYRNLNCSDVYGVINYIKENGGYLAT